MPIELNQLLALWPLDEIPFCAEGADLASHFMECASDACKAIHEAGAMLKRNVLIRAHKELVAHRGGCPKCNEVDAIEETAS
jgi:hypothetical protein